MLRELVEELCPEGVERVSIGHLITRVTEKGKSCPDIRQVYVVSNTAGMVRAEEYRENTIHSEDTSNYTVVRPNMIAYNPSRLNIGSIARLKANEPGLVSPMYIVFSVDYSRVLSEYFDYILESKYVLHSINAFKEEGARFRFDFSRWEWIEIPLPPIAIQREIVSYLNHMRDFLSALEHELSLRQTQYNFYRNLLLEPSHEETVVNVTEVCDDIFLGLTSKVDYVENDGVPLVRANNMTSGRLLFDDVKYISKKQHDKLTKNHKAQQGDILISKSGTLGAVCIIDTDREFSIYESLICLHPNHRINNRYLLHLLRSQRIQDLMLEKEVGNAIKHLNLQTFRKLYIPLPSLEKQEEIASILDVFEAFCGDESDGIKAEISLRNKQYEYYRDKLLNFEGLS